MKRNNLNIKNEILSSGNYRSNIRQKSIKRKTILRLRKRNGLVMRPNLSCRKLWKQTYHFLKETRWKFAKIFSLCSTFASLEKWCKSKISDFEKKHAPVLGSQELWSREQYKTESEVSLCTPRQNNNNSGNV